MANRVFLALTYADDPESAYDDDAIVAAANYMLPILWCAAFAPDDIAWRTVAADDDDNDTIPQTYPILLAATDVVRRRARDRRDLFFRAFPPTLEGVYADWLALLDGVDAPYLLVDTVDVWGMGAPDAFAADLSACVATFENDDPRYWSALLGQANITWDPIVKRMAFDDAAMPILLRGYEWFRPVPWAEPWDEEDKPER